MIFWILLVLGLSGALYLTAVLTVDFETLLGKIFFAPLFFILVGALAFGVALGLSALTGAITNKTHVVETTTSELRQINMGNNVAGSFFLGTGYVEGELIYNYYYQTEAGSLKADYVYAHDVDVYETTDGSKPRIVKHQIGLDWWIAPINDWSSRYDVYVPAGSIANSIEMDLPE